MSASDLLSITQCSTASPQIRAARPGPCTRHVTLASALASFHSLHCNRTCTHCHHARGSTQVISGDLISLPGPPTGYPGSPPPFPLIHTPSGHSKQQVLRLRPLLGASLSPERRQGGARVIGHRAGQRDTPRGHPARARKQTSLTAHPATPQGRGIEQPLPQTDLPSATAPAPACPALPSRPTASRVAPPLASERLLLLDPRK